jgi:outer membrane lipopolysaccharide assembly protein LptE/RlpB|tara:strand:+ start:869 stop:1333 length:465 start_codon:yes stop_codon:yes gene_type:complete
MLKKTFTLVLFLFLSSCGYEAIHSKKNIINYDFYISGVSFEGDRDVNLKIKEKLNNYTLNKKNKIFTLKISSTTEKVTLLKNISGDATSYKSVITVNIQVLMENITKSNLQIVESFNYNNDTNKFDLKRYEREIKNNLAETATDKLIFKLSNIQ